MAENRLRYFLILFSLSCLGVLGNYLNLPLFFGVSFIFGSIAVLIAIRVLGTAGAVSVALIAGAYTYVIWGHPYALVIFTVEALVVSILWKRKRSSLLLADILFWVFVGIPLVWLFYNGVMGMGQSTAAMIGFKQTVNGVANAIIATYLILLIPPKYILHTDKDEQGKIHLNELLFTTLLGIPLVFSFVLVSFANTVTKENLESGLAEQLQVYLDHIEHNNFTKDLDAIHDDRLRHKRKFEVMIFSGDNAFVDSTLPFDKEIEFTRKGTIKNVSENLSLWMPERNNLPLMLWWKQAYYFVEKPLSGTVKGKVYVMQNTGNIIKNIQMNTLTTFELLFSLIVIGGIAAYSISRSLTSTIVKLTIATKNLPEKLKHNSKIIWPTSSVTEFLQLSQQAKIMSDNISSTFDEVNMQAKTILESSIDSIITIDENGIILNFNHAAETLFGYERNEIIGKSFKMLVPDKHKDFHDVNLMTFNLTGYLPLSGKREELTGLHKNGRLLPIEMSVTKTEFNKNIRFTGIITDISERKINEQLKRDFISTVSHELRTPLTSISGSVKLIQGQQGLSDEQSAILLDTASRNIERLTALINDLLDFEKLESSGIEYDKTNTRIEDLIGGVLEQTNSLAEQKNITLKEIVEEGCDFVADPKRVSQIMVNFVSNAIKFSSEKSSIEIGCVPEGAMIKIYVKDFGKGIPDKFKSRIFERFTQADSSDDRQIQRGTGLGLAISKRMTEDMGGTIGFDSIEGKGSTFFVLFPIA